MTDPSRPEDPAHRALDAHIKRTVATSALRQIRRLVDQVEAEDRIGRRAAWIAFITLACVALAAAIFIFAKQQQTAGTHDPNRRIVFAVRHSPLAPVQQYSEEWQARVESIAKDNYTALVPKGTYGQVTLTSYINADGSVWRMDLNTSSGIKNLDAAAEKIVRRAAPFKPFPAELKEIADTVAIIRAFNFEKDRSK